MMMIMIKRMVNGHEANDIEYCDNGDSDYDNGGDSVDKEGNNNDDGNDDEDDYGDSDNYAYDDASVSLPSSVAWNVPLARLHPSTSGHSPW